MLIRLLVCFILCMALNGCTPKAFIQSEQVERAKMNKIIKKAVKEEEQANNPRCAFRRYYARALQHDAYAQYMLSLFYLKGVGVNYSLEKSVHWYKKAEQTPGHIAAEYRIGKRFLQCGWFEKDEEEALRWLKRSALHGCIAAQNLLGDLYHRGGECFDRDDTLALHWYHKSAAQYDAYGQYSIGMLYYNGDGVKQNCHIAAQWFYKAAKQGARYAQYMLARMYHEGIGLKKNNMKAYGWWSLCPEARYEETKPEYRDLVDPMTPEQRVKAYEYSQQYKRHYLLPEHCLPPCSPCKPCDQWQEPVIPNPCCVEPHD